MSEEALSERLKWIRDEYFEGKANALARAMGCSPGYVTPLLSGKKKNLGHSLMENLVKDLSERREARWVTVGWIAGGGARGDVLKEPDGAPSTSTQLKMLEDERKEFATAIQWLVGRTGSDDALEDLHREVWRASISRAAKQAVINALMREQERRQKKQTASN